MKDAKQRKAAKDFAAFWKDKGYEKGESQLFWTSLLRNVFGIDEPEKFIIFEEQVKLDHTSFIDAYIPDTRVMIEQKSIGKDLGKAIRQSDGTLLTPFQQAKRYITELPLSQHPRWVVTCNFEEFRVYDMERPSGEPEKILLKDLEKEYYRLSFLVDKGNIHLQKEMEVSIAAGEIVGLIYDACLKQYVNPESEETLKSLNKLCVRLVFCLYAEDAGIFGRHDMFHNYLANFETRYMRNAIIDLFKILDTPIENRDPYLDEDLAQFPYVNGGLFEDEDIEIPQFTEDIRDLLLEKASMDFDWSEISPTIFGAVFESTLNPETRRSGGMHYTSIENIHKVIDPLFLDDLKNELQEISDIDVVRTRNNRLKKFQEKLASLTFLDPACGSGNFLTETYLSLRRLENDVIRMLSSGQMSFATEDANPIEVKINQFYGIEINDFAVTVAKTALWIAESQMLKETEDILLMQIDFLPLTTNASIIEGNALRLDWSTLHTEEHLPTVYAKRTNILASIPENTPLVLAEPGVHYEEINLVTDDIHIGQKDSAYEPMNYDYIMGNPPFVGYSLQSKRQKEDILSVYKDENGKQYKTAGKIDYVAGWYFKASQLIQHTNTQCAFVSTNSITQGEQVASVWKPLYERFGIHIDFAYRTFRWDSEANIKAHVHCVIVGFSSADRNKQRKLYDGNRFSLVDNINPYLISADNFFIVERRNTPISDVPIITRGSQPTDNGNLILTEVEKDELLKIEPQAEIFIRPYMMGKDFINRKYRYCLWMAGANPSVLKQCPSVLKRIERVKEFRLKSKKAATRKKAVTPMLFDEIKECKTDYIAIPKVSSERRRYIPMEYLPSTVIAGDKIFMMPNATLYHFGVLTSNIHMAWMRTVGGRLKSDYSYSNTIVYNNFPWCTPMDNQKSRIEQTAQAILDARALYPDSSLADLYDELTMPPELRKAHQENDKAVMAAYGIKPSDEEYKSESACVAMLMRLYQKKISELD